MEMNGLQKFIITYPNETIAGVCSTTDGKLCYSLTADLRLVNDSYTTAKI